jgi:hypothetical protein
MAGMAVVLVSIGPGMAAYRMAMASPMRADLTGIFLPAAQAIRDGHSPYTVAGYVYSPLYALMFVLLVSQPWGVGFATAMMIACGALACWIATLALTRGRPSWHGVLVGGVSSISLLWNWPAWIGLIALRPELAVLALLVGAGVTHRVRSGFLLGLAGVLKTWPAVLGLWLLRPRSGRWQRGLGFVSAGLLAGLLAVVTGGSGGVMAMVDAAVSARSQAYVAVSVPGAARMLFRTSPLATPLVDSTACYWLALVVGFALLAFLAMVVWRRPGNQFIALFNMVFLVLLALPVSHYSYLVLPLPALWFWLSRALRAKDRVAVGVSVILAGWWLLVARNAGLIRQAAATTLPAYLAVFLPTLLAAVVSVCGVARLYRPIATCQQR